MEKQGMEPTVESPGGDERPTAASPVVIHRWLAPGQRHTIAVGGVEIVLRLVERRGRRARVAVEALEPADVPGSRPRAASPSRTVFAALSKKG